MGRSAVGKETFERIKNNARKVNLSGRMYSRKLMDSTIEFSKKHHHQAFFTTSTSHRKKKVTRRQKR